jgi:hypothetical protein
MPVNMTISLRAWRRVETVVTEGIARLENMFEFGECGGVVVVNGSTSAVGRKYLGIHDEVSRAKAELHLLISLIFYSPSSFHFYHTKCNA